MIKLTVVVAGLLFWTQGMVAQERSQEAGKPENHVTTDPEQAKIVTSDIALFWRQYDSAAQMGLDAAMDDYLKNGSYGLQQFTLLRIHSASNLAAVIRRHPKYTPRFGRALRRSPRCRGRSEGSADFIGEMIVGKIINDHLRAYGDLHEREFWLRDVPPCVAPDPDCLAGRDDLFGKRLEEDLWPLGVVDAVVGAGAELGFHHSGFATSEIGHTRGPHLLGFNRRQQPDAVERVRGQSGRAETRELVCEVGSFEEALHAMHAGIRQIDESLTVRDQPDADVGTACRSEATQFHETVHQDRIAYDRPTRANPAPACRAMIVAPE